MHWATTNWFSGLDSGLGSGLDSGFKKKTSPRLEIGWVSFQSPEQTTRFQTTKRIWAEIGTIGKCMFVIGTMRSLPAFGWPFLFLFFLKLYHTLRQIGRHLSVVRLPDRRTSEWVGVVAGR